MMETFFKTEWNGFLYFPVHIILKVSIACFGFWDSIFLRLSPPIFFEPNDELVMAKDGKGKGRSPPPPPAKWTFSFRRPFNLLSFNWVGPLVNFGEHSTLQEQHLPDIQLEEDPVHLFERFSAEWTKELKKLRKQASMFLAAFRVFSWWFWVFMPLKTIFTILSTQLLGGLINFYSLPDVDEYIYSVGLPLTLGVALSNLTAQGLHHFYFFFAWRRGLQLRIGSLTLVYDKLLKLRLQSCSDVSTGRIVNLASTDIERLQMAGIFLPFLVWSPVEALIVFGFMYREVGPPAIAGFGILMLGVPVTSYFSRIFAKIRRRITVLTDKRNKAVREIVDGIRVVKGNAYEDPFSTKTLHTRNEEIKQLQKGANMRAINEAIFFMMPALVLIGTFSWVSYRGEPVTARKIFVMMSLANIAQLNLTKFFAFSMQSVSEGMVTFARLKEYLLIEQDDERASPSAKIVEANGEAGGPTESDTVVQFHNASFAYSRDEGADLALRNISLAVKRGELIGVCGKVACGKSSLLLSILGETELKEGTMTKNVGKGVGYASQEAWMRSATIRENILFGEEFDKERYDAIVKACALEEDLDSFACGDSTMIGEKGINLSGGQKARISLARACYQPFNMFLLDDPLSAVDTIVGEHLFAKCISTFLAEKTRILVTHQTQYLPGCDRIVVMNENGSIEHVGTYSELIEKGVEFPSTETSPNDSTEEVPGQQDPSRKESFAGGVSPSSVSPDVDGKKSGAGATKGKGKQQGKGVVSKEVAEVGAIKASAYLGYWRAGSGTAGLLTLALLMVAAELAFITTPVWANEWAKQSLKQQQRDANYWLGWLAGCTGIVILLSVCRAVFFFFVCVQASRTLFVRMLTSVLRAPIGWFDANPSGRILNRFSSDCGMCDDQLAPAFYDFIALGISVCAYVCMTIYVIPFSVVSVFPIVLVFTALKRKYLKSSREVKRLEAMSRSPVFTQISETLVGLVTVRAFHRTETFREEFFAKQKKNVRSFFAFISVARWFGVRLDLICSLFATSFVILALVFQGFHRQLGMQPIDPGLMGLTLTCVISLCDMFQWCVRQSAEVENLMVSAERIMEYWSLPSEAPLTLPKDSTIGKEWPAKGELQLNGLSVSYRKDLDATLKGVTCTLPAGKSIAIVGRTAAGKSTLVQALLRLIEPAGPKTGEIVVDGVDIAQLGLKLVRQRIMLIGQTPWLFSGTLRKNMSPFGEYSDDEIWNVLGKVSMASTFRGNGRNGLDSEIAESGSNLSVGQKQLICLARCLLGGKKIFIFDEPTANIDNETDSIIQNAIRTMDILNEATIITVAHRLGTIIDYDIVLVMENGKLAQFGSPWELLSGEANDQDSGRNRFLEMVQATGESTAAELMARAKEASQNGSRR